MKIIMSVYIMFWTSFYKSSSRKGWVEDGERVRRLDECVMRQSKG